MLMFESIEKQRAKKPKSLIFELIMNDTDNFKVIILHLWYHSLKLTFYSLSF